MTIPHSALGERAMLVSLSVSIWSARKHDVRISDKVAAEHGADRSMGRYAKHLIPRDLLAAVKSDGRPRVDKPESNETLHARRRGCLKNGNPSGDLSLVRRCGARTRAGCPCCSPAMANGRCRMHGGSATGARTPEGLQRCRTASLTHGQRSAAVVAERRKLAATVREIMLETAALRKEVDEFIRDPCKIRRKNPI
jgi:hypothetical protein